MKKITLFLILAVAVMFSACEDVIGLDLKESRQRLVVEANIDWQKGEPDNWQVIRLSLTAPYYDRFVEPATGAEVLIFDSNGNTYEFEELPEENVGYYGCENFNAVVGLEYELVIYYNNEYYHAREKFMPVPDLQYAEQAQEGFLENQLVIKAFFDDDADTQNFYMSGFRREQHGPEYGTLDDQFTNGNNMYASRIFSDLTPGEEMTLSLYGISERYYNYMGKVLTQVSEGNLGPFQVVPADLRGNITNTTNGDNYPYGYFRLGEVSTINYIVQ